MATVAITDIKAVHACKILGVTYAKDQRLTATQVRSIPHISVLLSNGLLYTVPERNLRKITKHPRPTTLTPAILRDYT